MQQKKSFVVVVPAGSSGGIIVVRYLGLLLQKKGFQVSVFCCTQKFLTSPRNVFSLTMDHIKIVLKMYLRSLLMKMNFRKEKYDPLFELKEKFFPVVSKNTIVVYPEIVYGNPLHAKKVVRWFLFKNRFPNDTKAYGKDELTFSFRSFFNDPNLNPSCRILLINYFNKDLYKQTNFGLRDGVCYIIRKGRNRNDLPKEYDGPIIDNLPEREKVAVLNRCKYCYDYDTQTFYTSIACCCGCIPIIVMEPGKKKADYVGVGDFDYGKAYGDSPEQIEYAIKTRQKRLDMLDFRERNDKNVDFFLHEVFEYFGKAGRRI